MFQSSHGDVPCLLIACSAITSRGREDEGNMPDVYTWQALLPHIFAKGETVVHVVRITKVFHQTGLCIRQRCRRI